MGEGEGARAESALGLVLMPVQGWTVGWGRADKQSLSLMGPAISTAFMVKTHFELQPVQKAPVQFGLIKVLTFYRPVFQDDFMSPRIAHYSVPVLKVPKSL